MRQFVTIFAVVANLTLLDAIVKESAVYFLKAKATITVLPRFFSLAYVENRGCAWGMFQGHVWPLAIFGIAIFALLVWKRKTFFYSALQRSNSKSLRFLLGFAECLIYSGIIGNLIDRFYRGYVIDMFDFHWDTHHFPCFNCADSYLTVGWIILLAVNLFIGDGKKESVK